MHLFAKCYYIGFDIIDMHFAFCIKEIITEILLTFLESIK